MRRLRVVELYAGTGRSLEPFRHWRRAEIALLVDNSPLAANTYRHNFENAPYALLDLARVPASEVLRLSGGRIDVLLGCPPCQGFSDVGMKDPHDPRNKHMRHFERIAAATRPLAIGMENVPLAAASQEFDRFVDRFERLGYRWTAGILNAALHGSAQCRQRLIYVALREDLRVTPTLAPPTYGGVRRYFSYWSHKMELLSDRIRMLGEAPSSRRTAGRLPHRETALGERPIPTIGDVLEGLPRVGSRHGVRLNHFAWAHTPSMLRRMSRVPEGGRWAGGADHYSHAYARLHRRGLARTITNFFPNPGSGRFWHPTEDRTLTLREAARLQGFPDSFVFVPHYSKAAFLVGNALDARLAEITYDAIRNALD